MSELLLYIVATAVVLAGVAYFFVKQREQELAINAPNKRGRGVKGKKETKAKEPKQESTKEPKVRVRKPRAPKEEQEPVPLTKKQLKAAAREEDETRSVMDFLKNKKFSSDASDAKVQPKIRTAAAIEKKEVKKAPIKVESESETDSDNDEGTTDYVTIKRKQQNKDKGAKDAEEQTAPPADEDGKKKKNKPKFFTVAEKEAYEAERRKSKEDYEARVAEREARKNLPPGERRERRKKLEGAEGEEGSDGFKAIRERKPRRERKEGEEAAPEGEGEGRRKYPPREPDVAPPFETEYQTADMDTILNSLTAYYRANPDANVSKKVNRSQPKAQDAEAEEDKE